MDAVHVTPATLVTTTATTSVFVVPGVIQPTTHGEIDEAPPEYGTI
jgi:hypothetical protein